MARPISDEELQLKKRARRRLVGAVVVVTAAAVILPMVLDSEPRSFNQNVDIHIPSPDAGEFKPKGAPAPATNADAKSATPAAPSKGETPATKSAAPAAPFSNPLPPPVETAKEAPAEPETKIAAVEPPKQAKKPAPKEKESASKEAPAKESTKTASGAYVVQVAALADPNKARQLEKQMAGAGLKTYTEVVSTGSGEVTRVRAGPYPTREAAEKARTQLKKAGLDGKVVPK